MSNQSRSKKCITLNLAVDEEYERLMQDLGGEEHISKSYPEVFSRIQNIREENRQGKLLDDKTILETEEPVADLRNAVYFPAVYYNKGTLTVYIAASFCELPKALYFTLQVYDSNNLLLWHEKIDVDPPQQFVLKKYSRSLSEKNMAGDYRLELRTYVVFPNKDLSAIYNYEDLYICSNMSSDDVFADRANVNAPKKSSDDSKTQPDNGQIRAFYGRYPFRASERDVDYVYENAYDSNNGKVRVMLEAGGYIALSKNIEGGCFTEGDDIAIMDFGCGAVKYTSKGAFLGIANQVFSWMFKPDWNAVIPSKYYFAETVVNLSYKLGIIPPNEISERTLFLSSLIDNDMGNSCRKIRKLHIQIGCVEEHMHILMADGCNREIRDIKIGDQIIASPKGETGKVENIWKGKEAQMYYIATVDGHGLLLTGSHYVLTDTGMVMARNVNLGMQIVMEGGRQQTIKELYTVEESATVYNLSVIKADGSHGCMICEGMVLADNDYNEEPKKCVLEISQEKDEFLMQLDTLMKESGKTK